MVKNKKAWIVTVEMGYGHQRATYPLKDIAYQKIIEADSYPGIPASDKKIWQRNAAAYEFISRFKRVPVIGEATFEVFDFFQSIAKFYPRRDLSRPSFQLKETYNLITKQKWGQHLIKKLAAKPLPFITSFFAIAYMAEIFGYPGEIYLLVCDADISRAWAPLNSAKSFLLSKRFITMVSLSIRTTLNMVPLGAGMLSRINLGITACPLSPTVVSSIFMSMTSLCLSY